MNIFIKIRLKKTNQLFNSSSPLQECAHIFETLQTDYYEEYKIMGLSDLAAAVVHPLLKDRLSSWDPLKVCCFIFSLIHIQLVLSLIMLLLCCYRTAHTVLKTLVNGELFLNPETFTRVDLILPWTLIIGAFYKTIACAPTLKKLTAKA